MWCQREFEPYDLERVALVIAATATVPVNRLVYREARRRGVFCNLVDDVVSTEILRLAKAVLWCGDLQIAIVDVILHDDPPHCDFYFPPEALLWKTPQ